MEWANAVSVSRMRSMPPYGRELLRKACECVRMGPLLIPLALATLGPWPWEAPGADPVYMPIQQSGGWGIQPDGGY